VTQMANLLQKSCSDVLLLPSLSRWWWLLFNCSLFGSQNGRWDIPNCNFGENMTIIWYYNPL
jgi:hypothetical protein